MYLWFAETLSANILFCWLSWVFASDFSRPQIEKVNTTKMSGKEIINTWQVSQVLENDFCKSK